MSDQTNNARTITGIVVSDKMQNTIVVAVERIVKHPKYGKMIKRRTKLHADDKNQVAKVGNMVRIKESRPLSKHKSWELVEVLS